MRKRIEPVRGFEDLPAMGQSPWLKNKKKNENDTEYGNAHRGGRVNSDPWEDRCKNWSGKHHSFVQEAKEEDAEKDSGDASSTPNDQHSNIIKGMEQGKLLRVNDLNPVGPQRPSDPCIKAGEEEGKKFITIELNSHHFSC